jgi:hypothetical protein
LQTNNTDTDDDLEAIRQAKLKSTGYKKERQKGAKSGTKSQKMYNQENDETVQHRRNTSPKNAFLEQKNAEASETYVTLPPGPRRSVRHEQNIGSVQKSKNAPKRPIGRRPIAAGVDRATAILGTVD